MNELERNDEKAQYSYSRTASFDHCKYEYYLNYIVKDDDLYLSEGNYYAEEGSYVHEILAMIFNGELDVDNALQYYIDNHDDNVFYKVKKSTMDKSIEAIADYFASLDLDWLNDYEVLGVELEQKFKVEDYNFIGYIDLLLRDKRDGRIVVIDHKSTEYPLKKNGEVKKKSEQSFESYKRQMYLYCHAVRQKYGELPKEISWNYFKDGGKIVTIPFVQSEYEKAIKWFVDTVKLIEREEDFEPSEEFFYCTTLCGFRRSCEYHNIAKGD